MSAAGPLVSILTPSRNQARFLPDCLASVESQTYANVEHVVVDGASTDGTRALLEAAPPRVRWVSEPDRGQGHALNKAFGLSSGEIIAWVNADDGLADRRAIARAVEAFRRDETVGAVVGAALIINEENEILQAVPAVPVSLRLLRAVNYVIQPAVLFRRSVVEAEPALVREDLEYVIDRDLWFRLAPNVRFGTVAGVVGVDRHQRERKVLDDEFWVEFAEFDRSLGIDRTPATAALAVLTRLGMRLGGAATTVRLDSSLDPAFGLRLPPRVARLRRQLTTRRRGMSFT